MEIKKGTVVLFMLNNEPHWGIVRALEAGDFAHIAKTPDEAFLRPIDDILPVGYTNKLRNPALFGNWRQVALNLAAEVFKLKKEVDKLKKTIFSSETVGFPEP